MIKDLRINASSDLTNISINNQRSGITFKKGHLYHSRKDFADSDFGSLKFGSKKSGAFGTLNQQSSGLLQVDRAGNLPSSIKKSLVQKGKGRSRLQLRSMQF